MGDDQNTSETHSRDEYTMITAGNHECGMSSEIV